MNASNINFCSSLLINLAGKQSILELLCVTANVAISTFQQIAALMPLCLFAAIATPFALPQISIPIFDLSFNVSFETRCA
tara:strand:+ start:1486 stop:1725 length:240 start_codon:yes stop_codon:yes gene_type:complete